MACGGAQAPAPTSVAVSTRLGDLPPLPFPLAQGSIGFRRLFEGVREALGDELPEPSLENERAYRRWVEVELHDWLERRGDAIRAASHRARSLSNTTDEELGIGEALVAYLVERTVEDVVSADVPGMRTDPARAQALRDAWRESMESLRHTGLEHWAVCARTFGLASPEDSAWGRRCDDESEGVAAPEYADEPAEDAAEEDSE